MNDDGQVSRSQKQSSLRAVDNRPEQRPVALLEITLPTPCKVFESVQQQELISKWKKMASKPFLA